MNSQEIILQEALQQGNQSIQSFQLRTPNAGDLRGVPLLSLMQLDTDALITLLPRLSTPSLSKAQVAALSIPDVLHIAECIGQWFEKKDSTIPAIS